MKAREIVQALLDGGMTQDQISAELGTSQATVSRWLNKGQEPSGETRDRLFQLAEKKGLQIPKAIFSSYSPNATLGPTTPFGAAGETIPVYGQAIGGQDGRFVLNGNKISDILAPPILIGILDAYAVYVVGDSVEPRFNAGETVYVNPHMPVRSNDWVVVQIRPETEGSPPDAFIKQFVSKDERRLRLRQLNPDKHLEFPSSRVISIHKIVGSAVA